MQSPTAHAQYNFKRWMWGGAVVALLAATLVMSGGPVWADEADPAERPVQMQLLTTDGRTFVGELVRDVSSHVLLRIGSVEARFERADVARLSPVPDAAARFSQRRAALADDDLSGRLELAREMFTADLLDAARWELVLLQAALPEGGPGRDQAASLLAAVEARRALQNQPEAEPVVASGGADKAPPDTAPAAPRAPRPVYLSETDINLVRVYEIDLNHADSARVSVPEVVLLEAIAENPTHPAIPASKADRAALLGGPGADQLAFLFALEARSLYAQARVRQDPETLAAFRREINPSHVARYFEPHFGGGRVPGLDLVRYRPNTTAEAYTNFVSLCRSSHGGRPMIDRYNPEASLLLQWALPRDEARHPAPDLPGWRPRFRSLRDPRCTRLRDWIDGLVKFDPNYAALLPGTAATPPLPADTKPDAGEDKKDTAPDADHDAAPAVNDQPSRDA